MLAVAGVCEKNGRVQRLRWWWVEREDMHIQCGVSFRSEVRQLAATFVTPSMKLQRWRIEVR
jgi:hypothetical protein